MIPETNQIHNNNNNKITVNALGSFEFLKFPFESAKKYRRDKLKMNIYWVGTQHENSSFAKS